MCIRDRQRQQHRRNNRCKWHSHKEGFAWSFVPVCWTRNRWYHDYCLRRSLFNIFIMSIRYSHSNSSYIHIINSSAVWIFHHGGWLSSLGYLKQSVWLVCTWVTIWIHEHVIICFVSCLSHIWPFHGRNYPDFEWFIPEKRCFNGFLVRDDYECSWQMDII